MIILHISIGNSNNNATSGGCSILVIVQVVFIILKVCGLIDWPWKIVLIPLWIALGLIALIFIFVVIGFTWINKHR